MPKVKDVSSSESGSNSESEEEVKSKKKPAKEQKKKDSSSSEAASASESEEEVKSKKRTKKIKDDKASKKAKKSDDKKKSDDNEWDLGSNKRVTVRQFGGKWAVDIREMYMDKNSGEMRPGKKGIFMNYATWKALYGVADEVNKCIEAKNS